MASLVRRLTDFARSPRGSELAEKAKQAARDPQNRRRLEDLRRRLARKR